MSRPYVRAKRAPDTTFRACGFRGCTSFASHVLRAGDAALCLCCAQCAAVGVKAHREQTFTVTVGGRHYINGAVIHSHENATVIRFDKAIEVASGEPITFTVRKKFDLGQEARRA